MRNAEQFVQPTLNAILSQDYNNIEIVVVDDGSTDKSREIVESLGEKRVNVIDGPQKGISAALNHGVKSAKGEYIIRCDADDLLVIGRISRQINWLSQAPQFGAVCGSFSTIDVNGKKISSLNTGSEECEITKELQQGTVRTHLCTYALRKAALLNAGGFRSEFVTAEDIDFQLRLSEVTRVWYVPEDEYLYRLHDSSITHSSGSAKRKYFDKLARQMQHERAGGGLDSIQKGEQLPVFEDVESKPARTTKQHIFDQLIGEAWRLHAAGEKLAALSTGIRALTICPTSITAWKSFVSLIVKR